MEGGGGRLSFGDFELDSAAGKLFRQGLPVKIQPQPLRVLSVLLERPGEIVSREQLRTLVWGDSTFVEFDQGLNYCIRQIRLALRDGASKPVYVDTLPKQGYRFIAPVVVEPGIPASDVTGLHDAEPGEIVTNTRADPLMQPTVPTRPLRDKLPWMVAASFALLAVVGVWFAWRANSRAQSDAPLVLLPMDLGTGVSLFADNGPAMAISPDGSRIVFSSHDAQGKILLYWRRLDQPAVTVLAGTESAFDPFFSPNGKQVGFFADGRLKKVELETGIITELANAADPAGGSWGDNDTIVLNRAPTLDLWSVPANGGELTQITRDPGDSAARYWPQVLPGGNAIVFTRLSGQEQQGDMDRARVEGMFLKDGRRRTLVEGASFGRYASSGHLLYVRHGSVGDRCRCNRRFDATRLELSGPEVPVLNGVESSTFDGAAQFDFSNNGTLVYRASRPGSNFKTVAWMDSAGSLEPLLATPGDYRAIRLSPDGRRLALTIANGGASDIYVYAIERGQEPVRLTAGARIPDSPLVWSRDGRYIFFNYFQSSRASWWIPSDTSSQPKKLLDGFRVSGITADGTRLFVITSTRETRVDTWLLPITENSSGPHAGQPVPLLRGRFAEVASGGSPDGRWMAYTADETGTPEVYVNAVSDAGLKWPVSHGSGIGPSWSRTTPEIFYPTFFSPLRIMVAPYTIEAGRFQPGRPRLWSPRALPGRSGRGDHFISQSPDGKRFAVLMPVEEALSNNRVIFVMSFFDEIRRRLAAGGH